ncbi:MAG: glutamate--tRNA ligase [Terriglobia bacterium]
MDKIRVRFAPSPTGFLHVGGARTALYNWLFARRHEGIFILRIEDTDVDRSKPELVTAILESLKWLGLNWDEGPYFQSERLERYRGIARDLEAGGHAYPCFCNPEDLQARRAQAEAEHRPWKYDGRCRRLSEDERRQFREEGGRPALRFRVPEGGSTAFDDQVFGKIELAHGQLEDFVLLRSDGNPTYHLSVVVDDLDMRVTHVVRGADHLSNTPKQILLYQALRAAAPIFAHLPLILGPDRQRLSKRHGATAVGAYRQQGVLPEALFNFLALLGWTPPGQKEILSVEEMIRSFALQDVSKSNAVFDFEKLAWMNAEYLRNLPAARLFSLLREELQGASLWQPAFEGDERRRFERSVQLLQARARNLNDFAETGRAFFSDDFPYEPGAAQKFWKDAALPVLLAELADRLSKLIDFSPQETEKCLRALAEEKQVKAGLLINASRVALTGQGVAPSLFDVMEVLGKERVVRRLERAAEHLKATSVYS